MRKEVFYVPDGTTKEESHNYSVYIHKNLINGKFYVGQTSQEPEKRWCHGEGYSVNKPFYDDILKYGWEKFSHEIVATGLSLKEANKLERSEVSRLHSNNPNFGYNRSIGGDGIKTFEIKKIMVPMYPMLTMKQVADELGVHWRTVRRWILEGKINAIRIGRTVRISKEELERIKNGK